MLWALGAGLGWALLRDWVQAALVALLAPAWLAGEWLVATAFDPAAHLAIMEGLLLLALTYLSARTALLDSAIRRALVWIGAIALIPFVVGVATANNFHFGRRTRQARRPSSPDGVWR